MRCLELGLAWLERVALDEDWPDWLAVPVQRWAARVRARSFRVV